MNNPVKPTRKRLYHKLRVSNYCNLPDFPPGIPREDVSIEAEIVADYGGDTIEMNLTWSTMETDEEFDARMEQYNKSREVYNEWLKTNKALLEEKKAAENRLKAIEKELADFKFNKS